ncbi:TetR/AcrR family transcriptional regulator [Paenibacillus turpanensis]|uniref:TetR/AcrR family transcriptional regulator n=1 Tax=Paenibacillus turpanensis TaxID=2689078 RepID=UPI0014092025|nr:TetR family transcriptional regulator C-terminal domain-containing protein [Paenibacillus turpanensis]
MPKIVDHSKRKVEIAEAAWRVIRQEGLPGVTVRRVADEAGLSLGALRHYFDSQDELVAFAMRLISERVAERIQNIQFSGDLRRDLEQVIGEIMPLDEERRLEAEVWLAFAGRAMFDPIARELSAKAHDELHAGFRRMIELLAARKGKAEELQIELEAKRLHALVDGLVLHHISFPERVEREWLVSVVAHHLDRITGEDG